MTIPTPFISPTPSPPAACCVLRKANADAQSTINMEPDIAEVALPDEVRRVSDGVELVVHHPEAKTT